MQKKTTYPEQPIPIIEMNGICKRFGGTLANDRIDLKVYGSQIHALLGENGAGKSTLMKILYGFYRLDEGSIRFNGKAVQIKSPADARELNIGMVFQVLNLIPAMSVLENIALFLKDLPAVFRPNELRKKIISFSKVFGLEVNPDALVSHLSIGEQQKVEILKLLLSDARVLILDEPTRVLAPHEIEGLFSVLHRLRNSGYAIVLIAHKLREVLSCSDVITVLRAGKVTGEISQKDATEEKLIRMMFDRQLSAQIERKEIGKSELPVLELASMHTHSDGSVVPLNGINLKVYPGEIVGIAGVSGNGQRELCDTILGMEKITSGRKYLLGKDFTKSSTRQMRDFGTGFIPENPLVMAAVPFMSVLENIAIARTGFYARSAGFSLDWNKVKEDTQMSLEKFGFTFSCYAPAKALSGGNLQRLIIARELMKDPKLIIASYLTRGLDVQSALVARQELMQARNCGAGVVLVSEDLEELFSLSDRLIVLFEGRIVGEFKPGETDFYQIGYLMTGSKEIHHVNS
jgi:general nucleoside transport system ATP-binding protein